MRCALVSGIEGKFKHAGFFPTTLYTYFKNFTATAEATPAACVSERPDVRYQCPAGQAATASTPAGATAENLAVGHVPGMYFLTEVNY